MTTRDATVRIAGAVAVLAGTVVAVTGISLLPLVAATGTVLWSALARRVGRLVSAAVVAPGTAVTLLGVLMAAGVTGAPPVATTVVVLTVAGALGCTGLGTSAGPRSGSADPAPLWVPALLGPVVWLSAVVSGLGTPSAGRLSTVMLGDSATYYLYARHLMEVGGIVPGTAQNPVPLPSALLAVGAWAGRGDVPSSGVLRHDLVGVSAVWALLVAATCFAAGIAAAVTIGARHPRLAAAAGALASALPLSWFVSGYALEFGFVNAHVVLPTLCLSWAVAVRARNGDGDRDDAPTLLALMLATTVLLTTWTPAALVPVALGAMLVVRAGRRLVATRRQRLVIGLGVGQGLAATAVVVVPGLLGHGAALDDDGDVYPLPVWIAVAALVVGVAITAVAWRRRDPIASALGASTGAGALGVGGLVLVNAGADTMWNYYPLKLAWLCCVVALVTMVPAVVRLVADSGHLAASVGVGSVLVVATTVALAVAPGAVHGRTPINPLARVMADPAPGLDRQISDILAGADVRHPSIVWATGTRSETDTNFWILQTLAGRPSDDVPLYRLSYTYRAGRTADLCAIAALVPRITIRTPDPAVVSDVASSCPDARARVVVEPSR